MSFATRPEYAPIFDLQTMLRTLSPELGLGSDGIYGEQTKEAVRRFQQANGLTESGVTDAETWNAIVSAYERTEPLRAPAAPLRIVLQPYQVISPGEENLHMYLVQGMLLAMGRLYAGLPRVQVSGILDASTQKALRYLQSRSGLAETGALDKLTWRILAEQYRSAVGDGTGRFPIRRVK